MIAYIIINGFYGCIAGAAWSFAIHGTFKGGLIYGSIIGAIIGIFLYLFSLAAKSGNRITEREANFVAGSQSAMLLFLSLIAAVISFVIRVVF